MRKTCHTCQFSIRDNRLVCLKDPILHGVEKIKHNLAYADCDDWELDEYMNESELEDKP